MFKMLKKKVIPAMSLFLALLAPQIAGAKTLTPKVAPFKRSDRIVCIGDSITDGFSYPLMIKQALQEAGQPTPTIIDGGVANDTAKDMNARLERDVLPRHPTFVTFMAGTNDGLRGVTPEMYEAEVAAIAKRLRAHNISMLFLTPPIYGPKHLDAEKNLAGFNEVLHRLATKYNDRVAEVNAAMQKARARGEELLETDNVHPNYAGHRVMARVVLDALGYTAVPLPAEFKVQPVPGLLTSWQVRAMPDKTALLDARTVAAVRPDATWKALTLPETEPQSHWWMDQERKRGFAVGLDKLVGPAKLYQGVATIQAAAPRPVFFNTGADLQNIWLNGQQIYKNDHWAGWHAGKERIPATLQAGRNIVFIESGGAFFVGVTTDNDW